MIPNCVLLGMLPKYIQAGIKDFITDLTFIPEYQTFSTIYHYPFLNGLQKCQELIKYVKVPDAKGMKCIQGYFSRHDGWELFDLFVLRETVHRFFLMALTQEYQSHTAFTIDYLEGNLTSEEFTRGLHQMGAQIMEYNQFFITNRVDWRDTQHIIIPAYGGYFVIEH